MCCNCRCKRRRIPFCCLPPSEYQRKARSSGKKQKKTLKTSRMKVNNYGSLWDKCKGIPSFTHRHHHHHHRHRPHHHHHLLLKNQKTSLWVFAAPQSNIALIWLAFQTWFTLVKTGRYKTQAWLDSFTQRE